MKPRRVRTHTHLSYSGIGGQELRTENRELRTENSDPKT